MLDTRLRARLAASALAGAPALGLALVYIGTSASRDLRLGVAWLGLAAWIPATLGLEHFLKKVGDKLGALANGLGLVGALLGTNVVAAHWARGANAGAGATSRWIETAGQSATLFLMTALILFGVGYIKHRLVPVWVGAGLIGGACAWALASSTGSQPILWVGAHLLALSTGWMGWRLFRTPALWHQPYLSKR